MDSLLGSFESTASKVLCWGVGWGTDYRELKEYRKKDTETMTIKILGKKDRSRMMASEYLSKIK